MGQVNWVRVQCLIDAPNISSGVVRFLRQESAVGQFSPLVKPHNFLVTLNGQYNSRILFSHSFNIRCGSLLLHNGDHRIRDFTVTDSVIPFFEIYSARKQGSAFRCFRIKAKSSSPDPA